MCAAGFSHFERTVSSRPAILPRSATLRTGASQLQWPSQLGSSAGRALPSFGIPLPGINSEGLASLAADICAEYANKLSPSADLDNLAARDTCVRRNGDASGNFSPAQDLPWGRRRANSANLDLAQSMGGGRDSAGPDNRDLAQDISWAHDSVGHSNLDLAEGTGWGHDSADCDNPDLAPNTNWQHGSDLDNWGKIDYAEDCSEPSNRDLAGYNS